VLGGCAVIKYRPTRSRFAGSCDSKCALSAVSGSSEDRDSRSHRDVVREPASGSGGSGRSRESWVQGAGGARITQMKVAMMTPRPRSGIRRLVGRESERLQRRITGRPDCATLTLFLLKHNRRTRAHCLGSPLGPTLRPRAILPHVSARRRSHVQARQAAQSSRIASHSGTNWLDLGDEEGAVRCLLAHRKVFTAEKHRHRHAPSPKATSTTQK
jgi:hypothetical protein